MKTKTAKILLKKCFFYLFFIFFLSSCQNSTINKKISDFAVQDTSKVDKIIISDQNDTLILERDSTNWRVNSLYKTNSQSIKLLLQTISLVQMKTPLPENAIEKITEKLRKSTKISIFSQKKQIKCYYLGEYIEKSGNYAMLCQSKPVIIYIPSYDFDLHKTFNIEEKYWQSKILFNLQPSDIQEIAVTNYKKKTYFCLSRDSSDNFLLYKDESKTHATKPNNEAVNFYLSHFQNVPFQKFLNDISADSLYKLNKIFTISVRTKSGNSIKIESFAISNNDVKFWGLINKKSPISCKYYDFDLLIKDYEYFQR